MDPVFASVVVVMVVGLLAVIVACVAIAYGKDDIARDAIKNLHRLSRPNVSIHRYEKPDSQDHS